MVLSKLSMGADNLTYVLAYDKGRECVFIDPVDTEFLALRELRN